jgi:hypothetical protein
MFNGNVVTKPQFLKIFFVATLCIMTVSFKAAPKEKIINALTKE